MVRWWVLVHCGWWVFILFCNPPKTLGTASKPLMKCCAHLSFLKFQMKRAKVIDFIMILKKNQFSMVPYKL